ncbi:MAG: flagellar hook protein FlgE [Desulfobacterales bacterium]|nr:flagellar hook protein FlgE [Desulfobacterales bacterium]
MIGSLYAGISGLNANATAMTVIGDNIANVNTTAYKSNSSSFANVLSQASGGSVGNVGRGVEFQGTTGSWTDGTLEGTGNGTDLAINGKGFFIVNDSSGSSYYTRAGGFEFDKNGDLVNPNGLTVQGYAVNQTTGVLGALGDISVSAGSSPPSATTETTLTMNLDADATPVTGSAMTLDSANALADVTVTSATAGLAGNATSVAFTDPAAASQALSVSVSGTAITVSLATDAGSNITSTAAQIAAAINADPAASALVSAAPEGAGTGVVDATAQVNLTGGMDADTFSNALTVYDSLGSPVTLTMNFSRTATGWDWTASPSSGTCASTGTIVFDADGNLTLPASNPTLDITTLASGAQDLAIEWHLVDSNGSVTGYATDSATTNQEQDGYSAGSLRDLVVSEEGFVTGIYSNGQRQNLYRIALADFPSYQGLSKAGGNLYTESLASGQPLVGTPGSSKLGTISPSSLEGSNVDLSDEFVKMITTQRAFQANSRVITTSDEILQELINLKR